MRRALWLWCLPALLAAGVVQGQERPKPPLKPGLRGEPAARPAEQRLPAPGEPLPGDTLAPAGRDTLPRIDIDARRAALTEDGFPARDSVFEELKDLAGFHVIEYRGREVDLGVADQTIALFGDAQVNRSRDVLTADTIRYLGGPRFMIARHDIELVGADQKQVRSDSTLYYDVAALRGTVFDAETEFLQRGATWRVIGNVIPKAQDTVYATQGRFTSCDLDEPHYTFRAGKIKVVSQNVIVAWPVVLYVKNVPVFWMPFFASDIRPGRRSGILPPRFGVNDVVQTSSGAQRSVTDVGYYWAINDYMDAQATLDWFSGNYTRINGAFRYVWLKKFIRGSVTYSQSFSSVGRNLALDWNHDQELGLNTTLRTSVRYVSDTRLLQNQTFDPRDQTQTIDSDAGLNHRFSFANVSLSARRRQFLNTDRTETTLPSLNVSFSPVTLFAAPRTRAGPFNNITLSGSGNFSRRSSSQDLANDLTTTAASASSGLRLANFNVSGSASLRDLTTIPEDSAGVELPATAQTTISWSTRADYQLDLIGSTTLRPTVSIEGAEFRSPDTGGGFVSAPTRSSFGASLSSDVYGFWPGFGPFSRIRHKVSPGFEWAYSPEVGLDSALVGIPGFPGASGQARNTLTFTLRQTFEAKIKASPGAVAAGPSGPSAGDTLRIVTDSGRLPPDSLAVTEDGLGRTAVDTTGGGQGPPLRRQVQERTVTLLAINTSALRWDFERAKRGEPALVSEEITNSISSDLLRGLTINMSHDLFEGSGSERRFSPALTRLAMSFRLRSGQSLGDLVGLGGGTPAPRPTSREPRLDSRYRLQEFQDAYRTDPFDDPEAGPWDLSLRYSLLRPRKGESGLESQTLDGTLSFHPTARWSVRWSTQYSFTRGEFGQHVLTLDRDLHRWRASFQFARSPNGNVLFQVSVSLRDAPEIHTDYNQRTVP